MVSAHRDLLGQLPAADTRGQCGWDGKSFIPPGSDWSWRCPWKSLYLSGDTEAWRGLSRGPRLDALIKEEGREGVRRSGPGSGLAPDHPLPACVSEMQGWDLWSF